MPGIFDNKIKPESNKPQTATDLPPRQDFKSPLQAAAEATSRAKTASKLALDSKERKSELEQMEAIDQINGAGSNSAKANEKDIEELDKISEEDLSLAEALIFRGYAEKTVKFPQFKDHTITVTTTSPLEFDIIDELKFDLVKANEDKTTGIVNLSDAIVNSAENMYKLALGYVGMDNQDFCQDKSASLSIIKRAINTLDQIELSGDIEKLKKFKIEIKDAIRKRANVLKKVPTPMIDFISKTKYQFDDVMFKIMETPNIVSK